MERWWERMKQKNINLGKHPKHEVEDLTGCIPLFLDNCVVENTVNLNVDFFKDIVSHALAFEEEIQSRCSRKDLQRYSTFILPTQLR